MSEAPPRDAQGIAAEGLVKHFGPIRAVDRVSFTVPSGSGYAIFGPNGAGKTTILRILAGLTGADEGSVHLGGAPRRASDRDWRARIGVLSHRTYLYEALTASENLHFHASLHGMSDANARVRELLALVDLDARRDDRVEGFSRGMRQRLSLARTLLHDPDVVLLDEPFSGLDMHGSVLLAGVLRTLRDGRRSLVLVTHDLSRGLELVDRWGILVRGRLVEEGGDTPLNPAAFDRLYRDAVERAA